ncbi:hypothetical protein L5515_007029 [Caenorhabditis briggsae]|uniref:Uncharacterized protein n=1 Tax=Caenorhabditis briggsae TaxID=6238 RepID=A0AAE9JK83_CAEBR|nr:hypothetical protein L5515_007029 [Caenorhabditis briggsae]
MNPTLTIALSLLSLSHADLLFPFSLSDDVISYQALLEAPSSNNSFCQDIQLNYCQYQFGQTFGLDDSVSYKNGTMIYNAVNALLNSNVTEFRKICKARSNFHACLGSTYYTCLNLHNRVSDTTFENAFDYVRTFRGLEWLCGGGYKDVIHEFDCIKTGTFSGVYQSCINTFNQTVFPDSSFCGSVQTAGNCLHDAYAEVCGLDNGGHFACENFRFNFDNACKQMRCQLN